MKATLLREYYNVIETTLILLRSDNSVLTMMTTRNMSFITTV
jgi:hypothetical protein